MSMEKTVRTKLEQELATTHLELTDLSDGCGAKFNAVIVSAAFEGLSPLERHRKVNSLLADELNSIHAFTMKTWTPEQHQKLVAKNAPPTIPCSHGGTADT